MEGAQVGTGNYTFRAGPDIVPGHEIPCGFGAVLAGHIHRAQLLTQDLGHRQLAAPVIYPGSIERTSFAERDEEKGYMVVALGLSGRDRGRLVDVSFVKLPARPMVSLAIEPTKVGESSLTNDLRGKLAELDPNSIVRIELRGPGAADAQRALGAPRLRELAPPSMNITLRPPAGGGKEPGDGTL